MIENLYSEKQVLSNLITDYNKETISKLTTNDFNLLEHRMIFDSIKKHNGNIEMVLNSDIRLHIEKTIEDIILQNVSISKLDHHIEVLKQMSKKRNLLKFAEDLKLSVYDNNIQESILNTLESIMSETVKDEGQSLYELSKLYLENYDLKPDFLKIDNDLGRGLTIEKGDLIIFAARPSIGKTAFQLQTAIDTAIKGQSVLCFSLEMKNNQLAQRLISNKCDIELNKIKRKELTTTEKKDLKHKIETEIKQLDIKIFDTITSLQAIKDICVKKKRETGLDLLMIDYLQLMDTSSNTNRNQAIGEITRELKKFAKRENIAVIILSQLSRNVENRADKRPILSDLRDSGEIEADVDSAVFLYRDEYYKQDTELKNIMEVIIRKQRQGITGTIPMYFDGSKQKIRDLTPDEIFKVKNVINKGN